MRRATYPLRAIRELFQQNQWVITTTAMQTALDLGLDRDDIYDCIVNCLSETHLYKTMAAEKRPGLMQDVYEITYRGQGIYLKLQIVSEKAVVISFKENERGGV